MHKCLCDGSSIQCSDQVLVANRLDVVDCMRHCGNVHPKRKSMVTEMTYRISPRTKAYIRQREWFDASQCFSLFQFMIMKYPGDFPIDHQLETCKYMQHNSDKQMRLINCYFVALSCRFASSKSVVGISSTSKDGNVRRKRAKRLLNPEIHDKNSRPSAFMPYPLYRPLHIESKGRRCIPRVRVL